MGCLGNLIWIICGGLLSALSWVAAGCLWCITIIGIPVGIQCFKLASLSLCPFGKDVHYGGGTGSFLLNIIWFIVSGWALAAEHLIFGVLYVFALLETLLDCNILNLANFPLFQFGIKFI